MDPQNPPNSNISQPPQNDGQKLYNPTLDQMFRIAASDAVKFLDSIFQEAVNLGSSDILFEPRQKFTEVRFRIDGVLYSVGQLGTDIYIQVASRLQILCKLNPTEKRKVQEGQFVINHTEKAVVNLRVEVTQTVAGRLIVIRIHLKETIVMDTTQLGLSRVSYENFEHMLRQRSGLILVCGPTGCGKTTTLYSIVNRLNARRDMNVVTIEDPVEFQLEGANQMQVQEDVGFTFADGLRTVLRLSPDIVLVGEIRDKETAEIAIESGLTGQLVLSTLHAEDSVGALFRLLDLGIEPYLLNSALVGIVAQRLVREVCPACKTQYMPNAQEIEFFQKVMGRAPKQLVKSVGCAECSNIGYKTRKGIFEVMLVGPNIRELIRSKANETEMREKLIKDGFVTLLRDGFEKAEEGITTIDEVLRNSLRFF